MLNNEKWAEEVELIKNIFNQTEMIVARKWGSDMYTVNGKNVCSVGGFKNFFTIWFNNGVFLSDPAKVLISAKEGQTKALRQWRFTSKDQINKELILSYVLEAIENEKEGKSWKPERNQPYEIAGELKEYIENNLPLKEAFEALSPYKQKEYSEYIREAKREATKTARLQKITPMIIQGGGLHDKYK